MILRNTELSFKDEGLIPHPPHTSYIPFPSHSPSFYHPNNHHIRSPFLKYIQYNGTLASKCTALQDKSRSLHSTIQS